jgi:hypothetical protein
MATGKLVSMVRPADVPVLARALLARHEAQAVARRRRGGRSAPRRRRAP